MVKLSQLAKINGEFRWNSYQPLNIDISKKGAPAYFARKVERGIGVGVFDFQLRIDPDLPVYPNIVVPLAGLISRYRRNGVRFRASQGVSGSYLESVGLLEPHTRPPISGRNGFTDRIWEFTAETHYDIISGIMESIRRQLSMEKGMMYALELCINEITDNVLNHSVEGGCIADCGSANGFGMAQLHAHSNRVAISVFDTGVGIFRTLKRTRPDLTDAEQAIELALQKGITSGRGRGNGLWILDRIVEMNGGSLEIGSDGVRYISVCDGVGKRKPPVCSLVSGAVEGTTLVDFQLDVSRPIALASVLEGLPITDLWIESREDDDASTLRLEIARESEGCGSRAAARGMRNLVMNVARQTEGGVILDFKDIEIMTTSYADELIVALCEDDLLSERLALSHLNEACERVIREVLRRPIRILS